MTEDIALTLVTRNPNQPRESFPQEHIERLASSIKRRGLIQPITLRPIKRGRFRFEIVAGECRFRAHQLLGAATIRAEIVEIDESEMQLCAIVENVQRQDMNPMEEAFAFKRLIDSGMTIAGIVEELGFKGRERVQNRLNLLELTPEVQKLVAGGNISTSVGSAIALAPHEHQSRIVQQIGDGTLKTVDQIRHAAQALRDAAAQLDVFADAPRASRQDVEIVNSLERRIEQIASVVQAGFDQGECVAAQRVSPDRVTIMADKLGLIRKHVLDMEHQLRRVAAQTQLKLSA